jgi:uncharacterized protein YndB with AHSA1/START domain
MSAPGRQAPRSLRVARRFAAPAPRVFDAWLRPALAARWLFATAGRPLAHVEIDARVGGRFRLTERREGRVVVHTGRYVDIARPQRLAFALDAEAYPDAPMFVTVDVVALGVASRIVVTHDGVPRERAADAKGRWEGMLFGLAMVLGAAGVAVSNRAAERPRASRVATHVHGGTSCNIF